MRKPATRKSPGAPKGPAVTDSTFSLWRDAMGFNKKQVSAAGALLGLGTAATIKRSRGLTEPSQMELLAMSALRAGLPPWSPKAEAEIAAVRAAMEMFRLAAESARRSPPKVR